MEKQLTEDLICSCLVEPLKAYNPTDNRLVRLPRLRKMSLGLSLWRYYLSLFSGDFSSDFSDAAKAPNETEKYDSLYLQLINQVDKLMDFPSVEESSLETLAKEEQLEYTIRQGITEELLKIIPYLSKDTDPFGKRWEDYDSNYFDKIREIIDSRFSSFEDKFELKSHPALPADVKLLEANGFISKIQGTFHYKLVALPRHDWKEKAEKLLEENGIKPNWSELQRNWIRKDDDSEYSAGGFLNVIKAK